MSSVAAGKAHCDNRNEHCRPPMKWSWKLYYLIHLHSKHSHTATWVEPISSATTCETFCQRRNIFIWWFIDSAMSLCHLKSRGNFFKSILSTLSFLFFRWHRRFHLYVFIVVLSLAVLLSALLPFGLLFNRIHLVPERPSIAPIRAHFIEKQKQQQQLAYAWLDQFWKNSGNFSALISNQTHQSRFYEFIDLQNKRSNISSYHLFDKPKQMSSLNRPSSDGQIVISILYSQQDTDHLQGRFYVGQVLHHLLRHHRSRFIITLCENNNTDAKVSDAIDLIRRLVPVFVVNTISSESWLDLFEREKQAHLQCILANFQSFPGVNHLLLLQDDAEPIGDDFYDRLLSLIDTRFERQWPLKGPRQQPAFVKIYHPRWLIDYFHPSFYMIVQLIATSLFVTLILFTGVTLVQLIAEVGQCPWPLCDGSPVGRKVCTDDLLL